MSFGLFFIVRFFVEGSFESMPFAFRTKFEVNRSFISRVALTIVGIVLNYL